MPNVISVSDVFKERGMDENPMRGADDKREALYQRVIEQLKAKGLFTETIEKTGKKNEHRITITLSI